MPPKVIEPKAQFPERYKGDTSATDFFQRYDCCCTANKWEDNVEKALQVIPLFGDKVFDFAMGLAEQTHVSYEALKAAVIQEYDCSDLEENYAILLQGMRLLPEEDMVVYMNRLKETARKAYPQFSQEIRDSLVMNQFRIGLSPEARRQVHLNPTKAESCNELLKQAKLVQQVEKSISKGVCARMQEGEDDRFSVMLRKLDQLSGEVAELRGEMTSAEGAIARVNTTPFRTSHENFNGVCRKCNKWGHMARDCRNKNVCHTCGNPGHAEMNCALNRAHKEILCQKCGNRGHREETCRYTGRPLN